MLERDKRVEWLDASLAIWRRRRWLAILVFAGPFCAIVSAVISLPDLYKSSAALLLEGQQVPQAFVRPTVTSALETRLQAATKEILSWSRLGDLVVRFNLYPELRRQLAPELVVEQMGRDIQLERATEPALLLRNATVFTVSYQGRDPETVAIVANMLASLYVEENTKNRERQASGTSQFLKVQLEEKKKQLEEQDRRLSEFKKRYMGELPQQVQANLATLERLNTELRLNREKQLRAKEQREATARLLDDASIIEDTLVRAVPAERAAPSENVPPAREGVRPTGGRLAELRRELRHLQSRFSDKYPDVVHLKAEIAALEAQEAEMKTEPPSTDVKAEGKKKEAPPAPVSSPVSAYVLQLKQMLEQGDAEIAILKAEEKRLQAEIATYQARIENSPRHEQEFQELSRDYQVTTNAYQLLLSRYEESRLSESLEQRQQGEQFQIMNPAVPARTPSSPRRFRLILAGVVLCAGLAAGAIVLAERLDTSIHTADDLRAFSTVPVLARIGKIVSEAEVRGRRLRLGLGILASISGFALIVVMTFFLARTSENVVRMLASLRL